VHDGVLTILIVLMQCIFFTVGDLEHTQSYRHIDFGNISDSN